MANKRIDDSRSMPHAEIDRNWPQLQTKFRIVVERPTMETGDESTGRATVCSSTCAGTARQVKQIAARDAVSYPELDALAPSTCALRS
jgi:hypothetical protein